jgi:hypothetical protein
MCHILLTWCCVWTEWPLFYSVVAVPRSVDPLTLKAAEFSVYALQPSVWLLGQHIYATVLPSIFFFFNTEVSRTFLPCVLHKPVRQNGTYFHCGVTPPSNWPYMIMKSLHCPQVFSSCNSFTNSWMLFQYTRSPTIVQYVMSDCLFL